MIDPIDKILDALEDMVFQHCSTSDGTFDSFSIQANAEALRVLAAYGRIGIFRDFGKRVLAVKSSSERSSGDEKES